MRTQKVILRKIKEWKDNPMLVAGIYRLFTYIPWEAIPDEYKSFFPEEAKDTWDDDLKNYGKKDMLLDINTEVRAILQVLAKKNVTHCLGLVPIVLADIYMYGAGINKFQSSLLKIISSYKEYVDIDRPLAEQYAIIGTVELLKNIVNNIKIKLTFDIDAVLQKLLSDYNKNLEDSLKLFASQSASTGNKEDLDYDAIIAEAEAKEAELKKAKDNSDAS